MASTSIKRFASALWQGSLLKGKGTMNSQSGAFKDLPFSVPSRFENGKGTNPEELIASAHAGCFSMALSAVLSTAHNLTPESINTKSTLTITKDDKGWTITQIHLDVLAKIPGADAATFEKAAKTAKETCPVSKVLNTNITMSAKLEK